MTARRCPCGTPLADQAAYCSRRCTARYREQPPTFDPAPLFARLADLTAGQVAELAGVSRRQVCRWRAGEHRLSLDAADRVAVALGTHLDEVWPAP